MRIQATHRQSDHDDLRLSEAEPFCVIARMIIKRAWRDSLGKVGYESPDSPKVRAERSNAMQTGIEFMNGGEFAHWCQLLGIDDPDHMLALIEERQRGN